MIKLPYGWDNAVHEAKEAFENCHLNNIQIAAGIILELDSQLRSPAQTKTVADDKQEGEKWTHVYTDDTGTDIRCALLAEHDEWAWVKDAGTVDTIRKSWLKPIKQTMTKDEQEAIAKFIARIWKKDNPDLRVEFDAFCKEHDIT